MLVVHTVLKPGGATRVAVDDAVALRQRGWDVGFAAQPGAWSCDLQEAGVRLHRLYLASSGQYPGWLRLLVGIPLDTLLLLYTVLRWHYRVLYLHHRQLGPACQFVALLTGARYVFIAHVEFQGGRLGTQLGRNILAVSAQVKQHLVTQFGIDPRRVQVLRNAVRLKAAALDPRSEADLRRQWDLKPGAPVVACVALLNEQKAHHVLLAAWAGVVGRYPEAVLLLAGDGPLRPTLEAQAARLGIAAQVRFAGMVPEIGEVYGLASFVVLSSAWEGMPLTLLEAAAYGLPAVATRVSGIPEVVREEETGLLVEPGDPGALCQAIIRLLGDDALRQRLGAAAADMCRAQFAPEPRLRQLTRYLSATTTHPAHPIRGAQQGGSDEDLG